MMPHKIPKTWEETFWHYGRKYGVLAHAAKKTGFATDFVQGIFNLIQVFLPALAWPLPTRAPESGQHP